MKVKTLLASVFYFVLFFQLLSQTSIAAVRREHPRIWLDGTIKTKLMKNVNSNTPEWLELKSWCDNNLGARNSGYQGMGFYNSLMNYALCFQMTGNQAYGNEGVKYLTALLRDKNAVGDGLGGASVIQVDSGWTARTFGTGVAIARDWLDGASDLTPDLIDECVARLTDWITWFDNNGFSRDNPNDNYYAGYFCMKYTAGFSFYYDNSIAQTWKAEAADMWSQRVLPLINGYLDGGDWQEGWNYGHWATQEYLLYPHALKTATTDEDQWPNTDWNLDLIKSQVHMLYPARNHVSDDGSWSGSFKGNPFRATMLLLSVIGGVDSTNAGLAAWYANHLTWEPVQAPAWQKFLWTDPGITQVMPTKENMEGLAYRVKGTNRVLARSAEWENTNATFVEFAAPATGSATEGEMNVGEFKIASRGKLLVVDSDTWEASSYYSNTLLINGEHTYAPAQEWWRDNVSMNRFENGDNFMYAVGNNLENAYDGVHSKHPSASSYDREVLFVHPDYVFVLDSVVPTNPTTNTITSQVNFYGNPDIVLNEASCVNGNAKIFMKILGPEVRLVKTDRSDKRPNVWLVKATPLSTATGYKLLHVFQTTNSDQLTMSAITEINADNMSGVLVADPIKNVVFLHGRDPSLTDVVGPISYGFVPTVPASQHFLTNLPPGQKYEMTSADNLGEVQVTLTPNNLGSYTASSQGVLQFSLDTRGATPKIMSIEIQ